MKKWFYNKAQDNGRTKDINTKITNEPTVGQRSLRKTNFTLLNTLADTKSVLENRFFVYLPTFFILLYSNLTFTGSVPTSVENTEPCKH